MEKLIVVGMRYCDKASVDAVVAETKKSGDVLVEIVEEINPNGVGNKALAVYYIGYRVGYIRNADLTEHVFKEHKKYVFTVRKCQANYWILDAKHISTIVGTTNTNAYAYTTDPKSLIFRTTSSEPITDINSTKDEKKMINTNSMRDSFFREVKNVAIDIQSGKFGVVTPEGLSVYDNGGISVNPIADFGVKVPAFAMRVPVADLKAGDIIVGGSEPTFFVEAFLEGGYEVVNMSGEHKVIGSVNNMFFGKNSVLAVKNMFGEGTNPMMMALMLGDSKEGFDMKTFAMMSMMGGGSKEGNGMDSNMLMMMMLMGK